MAWDVGARMSQGVGEDGHLKGRCLDGKYELTDVLGVGGMGVVYRGIQLSVDRPVAVKVISRSYSKDPSAQKRFRREAQLTCKLVHPNSIRMFDFGTSEEGLPYLVMELLEGHELSAEIRERGRLPAGRAVDVAMQVLASLHEAHRLGIVHRDMKPANVFLLRMASGRDHVKVMDFGIAKVTGADVEISQFTRVGTVVGSPSYMSPEQVQGTPLDGRSDLYSVGVILFEMLTGQKPFRADEASSVMIMQVETPTPRLRTVAPDLVGHEPLDAVIGRFMAKRRDERPASAMEAIALLEAAMDVSGLRRPVRHPPDAGPTVAEGATDGETIELDPDQDDRPAVDGMRVDDSTTQPVLDVLPAPPAAATVTLAAGPAPSALDATVNARAPVRGETTRPPPVEIVPTVQVERVHVATVPPRRPPWRIGGAILGLGLLGGVAWGLAPLLMADVDSPRPRPADRAPATTTTSPGPRVEGSWERGRRLLVENKHDEARAVLEEARAADPLDARVYASLGRLYYEKGQLDLALQELKRAEMRNHDVAETYLVLGLVKHEQGDKDAAWRAFERFLRLEPKGANADAVRAILKGGRAPRRGRR